jgi:hypothetical protein
MKNGIKLTVGNSVRVLARARAFSHQGIRQHTFDVTGEVVRVYDPVADHYTTCHCLSAASQHRIKRLASAL